MTARDDLKVLLRGVVMSIKRRGERAHLGMIPPGQVHKVVLSQAYYVDEDDELHPVPPCMDKLMAVDRRPSGVVLKVWDHIIAAREEGLE